MARDRRYIANEGGATQTAASALVSPSARVSAPLADTPDTPLAESHQVSQPRDHLLALVRALARDAARADHLTEQGHGTD